MSYTFKGAEKLSETGGVRDLKSCVFHDSAFVFEVGSFRGDYVFDRSVLFISRGALSQSLSVESSEHVTIPMGHKFFADSVAFENVPLVEILSKANCAVISFSKCKKVVVGKGGSLKCNGVVIFETDFVNDGRCECCLAFPVRSVLKSDSEDLILGGGEKPLHSCILKGFEESSEMGCIVDGEEAYWSAFVDATELPFRGSDTVPVSIRDSNGVSFYDVGAFKNCSFVFLCRFHDGFSNAHKREICFSVKDKTGVFLGKCVQGVMVKDDWVSVVCFVKADAEAKEFSFSLSCDKDGGWISYPLRLDIRKDVPRVIIFGDKK